MSNWLRIAFQDSHTHCVHSSLAIPLIADMTARGMLIEDYQAKYGADHAEKLGGNPKAVTEWGFDLGGGCYANMPLETIQVDGLSISVMVDMIEDVLRAVDKLTIRRFESGEWYYKLKLWCHATVMTPGQYDAVQDALVGALGSAETKLRQWKKARA